MKKILFIGNSFSQDATRYVEAISDGELFVRNLYIGGCSLERHAYNIENDLAEYEYQKDAECIRKISVKEALVSEAWDYVSIQQVSGKSGLYETYEPYIGVVIDEIKKYAPSAEIVFHRTWAYEQNSEHASFVNYGCDTDKMHLAICEVSGKISEKYGLRIIPTGNAVAAARRLPAFDIMRGGIAITRDGFHLSLDLGRYLAGLVLYRFFTGESATRVEFSPENCSRETVELLKAVADESFSA